MAKKLRLANGLSLGATAALMAACFTDGSTATPAQEAAAGAASGVVEVVSDRSQEEWLERRRDALTAAEAQVDVLNRARQELKGRRLGIQRDAAICFQARHLMDRQLRVAMQAGGEFAPSLDTWHAQARGVETFCAYALTVGAPR